MTEEFRTDLGRNIFYQKYALTQAETWKQRAKTIVDYVCGTCGDTQHPLMSLEDREALTQYITDFKFMPGGRYIYYAGREAPFYNNCLSGDTEFLTEYGYRKLEDAVGSKVRVLSPISKDFVEASVESFGCQEIFKLTFMNLRGRSKKTWEVKATGNHRWLLTNGLMTHNLKIGDRVAARGFHADKYSEEYKSGLIHGMVFADGNVHELKSGFGHQIRLCGDKSNKAPLFKDWSISQPTFAKGDLCLYKNSEINLKMIPDDTDVNYIAGFINGWIDFDGHEGRMIHTTNNNAMAYFIDNCVLANLVITGDVRVESGDTHFGKRKHDLLYCNFRVCEDFKGFKLVSKECLGEQEVYCVVEPVYKAFTLRDSMATGNCYLFKSEEDTREEWADLCKRVTNALMTGGGIGNDYSVFRPEGSLLASTGSQASGPIPLMSMINEIGRNVMQGGSRRCQSARSLVSTPAGVTRLEKLIPGDVVQTKEGYSKVVAVECTGTKPVYEVHTRCGVMESTGDHRHAVIRSVKPFEVEWVETKDITNQDTLVFFTKHGDAVGSNLLSFFDDVKLHHNAKPYKRPTNMSKDLAWFLGATCDAHFSERGIIFSQRESNVEFLNKAKRIAKDLLGVETHIVQGHKCLDLSIFRSQLSRDLKRYKSKHHGQLIHEDILNSSNIEKFAFIAGVLDADGTLKTTEVEQAKGTVNFMFACSSDKDWIYDFSHLINSLGIPVRVYCQNRGFDTTRKPIYKVQLADKSFANDIADSLYPYSIKVKKDYVESGYRKQAAHGLVVTRSGHNTPRVTNPMDFRSFEWPRGILPAKVEKIVYQGEDETYDIQVEKDGCFVCNGHLTHNSAIYASLNWKHDDAGAFMKVKDWDSMPIGDTGITIGDAKRADFNFAAPLDMTNISLNYDNRFLSEVAGVNISDFDMSTWVEKISDRSFPETFITNVRFAMMNGEPGFSFNFFDKEAESARNACCEVTSEDDSDVCNLGSVNMGRIETLDEMQHIVELSSKFLVCGTIRAKLPSEKIAEVREKNRRLGLGLMGVHEWLLKRGYDYEVGEEMHKWLAVYKSSSESAANEHCDRLFISRPIAYRAIAPAGTISILAGCTSGVEPLYAVAYKRRYLVNGDQHRYEYVIDHTAQTLIEEHDIDPEVIQTAYGLAKDPEKRIKFQADVQDYVDMAISSTLNLPEWGSKDNNEKKVIELATIVAKYAPRLRGLTFYPDGSRGGQPLTPIPYETALKHKGVIFEENDSCAGGICGI